MTPKTEARSRYTLHFRSEELEAEFQVKFRPRARRQMRAALLSSVGIWLTFGVLLYSFAGAADTVLFASLGMCVYLLASLGISRFAETAKGVQRVVAASNTVAGLVALYAIWDSGLFVELGVLSTLLVLLFAFTLANLPFVYAVVAPLPYLVLGGFMMTRTPEFPLPFIQAAFVLTIGSILATATYMLESATRRDFFLRRIIADQERELEEEKARQLGQYTLREKLGEGGMGVVYYAKHALLRRPTAIKVLSSNKSEAASLARFEREVQLTSELSHPNIVAVYDYGHSPEGDFYYAMEYLPGFDLRSLVKLTGPLPIARVLSILLQVCDALDEAHHRGLIHRDIKPANILLSRIGQRTDVAKVVDFGLVKDSSRVGGAAFETGVIGTPSYMAPEAIISPGLTGPPSDLYSLAATAHYLITGKKLFEGDSGAEICSHQVSSAPPKLSEASNQPIPAGLEEALSRCLEKDPGHRFPTAKAFRDALSKVVPLDEWTLELSEAWWNEFQPTRPLSGIPEAQPSRALTVSLEGR